LPHSPLRRLRHQCVTLGDATMTKLPIAHSGSGFASTCRRTPTHIEVMRQYATPCIRDREREADLAAAANLPYRSDIQYGHRLGNSFWGADYSIPLIRY